MKMLLCKDTSDLESIREVEAEPELDDEYFLMYNIKDGETSYKEYGAYLYPIKYKDDLIKVVTERARLKQVFTSSISLAIQLRNKIIRETR